MNGSHIDDFVLTADCWDLPDPKCKFPFVTQDERRDTYTHCVEDPHDGEFWCGYEAEIIDDTGDWGFCNVTCGLTEGMLFEENIAYLIWLKLEEKIEVSIASTMLILNNLELTAKRKKSNFSEF